VQSAQGLASDSAESNRQVFDGVADSYTDLALKPAEQRVLDLLRPRLGTMAMLDLGVGTGRTGHSFAPLVGRYVGVDYSPRMIERARALLGERENVELLEGDARDLAGIEGPFDFALFSFNGIDAVGHEDRLRVLAEVRRLLAPGGRFLFSSHSMGTLPLSTRKHRSKRFAGSPLAPLYAVYARLNDIPYGRRVRRVNAKLDLEAGRERGWIVVPGMGHGFRVHDYYVDPEHQLEQLREAGFAVEAIYDVAGEEVELPHGGRDPWLDYLCRPVAG
jgi:SAM-dependent methyltransferase